MIEDEKFEREFDRLMKNQREFERGLIKERKKRHV